MELCIILQSSGKPKEDNRYRIICVLLFDSTTGIKFRLNLLILQ